MALPEAAPCSPLHSSSGTHTAARSRLGTCVFSKKTGTLQVAQHQSFYARSVRLALLPTEFRASKSMTQTLRLLRRGLITSGPAQFHGRSPKGTLTFGQLEGQKMVLSSFEEFQPRDHSTAPRKPRPSRSIPSCAGHRAQGHATAVCAPHPQGQPAPRHTPRARIFKQNVTGEQGARSPRPPPPAETPVLGAASRATPSTEAWGPVPLHSASTRSTVPVPARQLCPPPRASARRAPRYCTLSRGRGSRHLSRWDRP